MEEDGKARASRLGGRGYKVFWSVVFGFGLWHFYVSAAGPINPIEQRSLLIGLGTALAFALYPASKGLLHIRWWEIGAIALSLFVTVFFFLQDYRILSRPYFIRPYDFWISLLLLVLVLEASRRAFGIAIPLLIVVLLLYTVFGPIFPGALHHRGLHFQYVIEVLFFSSEGIWGMLPSIMTSVVAIYILFGALAIRCGVGKILIDAVVAIAGRSTGGPAKVGVLASMGFGSISGSAAANVSATGTMTIPMMKKTGFKPEFAAAVEAAASTGGLIMPPIMGAGAFVMAEITGIPYRQIIIASAFPALMYYLGIFMTIHFNSLKKGLRGLPKEQTPRLRPQLALSKVPRLLLPVVVLIALIFTGWPIALAGFWACVLIAVPYLFLDFTRQGIKVRFLDIIKGIADGGKSLILLATIAGSCQLIISLATTTPIIIVFSNALLGLTNGMPLAVLLAVMFLVLVFGMGMPATGAYVVAVAVALPMMATLGLDLLASHLFIFYFSAISAVTPPIAIAAFVAAPIAEAPLMKTAWTAAMLAISGFIVPYVFVYSPGLLLVGQVPQIILAILSTAAAVICLSAAFMQYLKVNSRLWETTLLFVAAIFFLIPQPMFSLIAIFLAGIVYFLQYYRSRTMRALGYQQ